MISTVRDVRVELAAALAATLTTYDLLPAAPIPPFAVVMWPTDVEFSRTLGGHSTFTIPVSVFVSLSDIKYGQEQLDTYISGIPAVLEAHTTAVWRNIIVESANNFRPETLGEMSCLAADLNLTLIA